jgi:hypothetical protein
MGLAWAEQEIIARLSVEAAVAAVPVGTGGGEINRTDQRGVGISAQQHRPLPR